MDYIWFWTFWHWSRESFRSRTVLRAPLHGIASHWDEWFRHEASEIDRRAIENIGRTESAQRQFIFWLCRHWAPEANPQRNRLIPRFVLGQLAQVPPFNLWPTFARYRTSYGLEGIQAIVLAEKSTGEAADIRKIEALILPPDDTTSSALVTEGFQAEAADLEPALQGAKALLSGKGLAIVLAQWLPALAGDHSLLGLDRGFWIDTSSIIRTRAWRRFVPGRGRADGIVVWINPRRRCRGGDFGLECVASGVSAEDSPGK